MYKRFNVMIAMQNKLVSRFCRTSKRKRTPKDKNHVVERYGEQNKNWVKITERKGSLRSVVTSMYFDGKQ